eukprot:1132278-Pelagomonas_calceolata.AAC.1
MVGMVRIDEENRERACPAIWGSCPALRKYQDVGVKRKEKPPPAKRPRALRKGSLSSKGLTRVSKSLHMHQIHLYPLILFQENFLRDLDSHPVVLMLY